MNPSVTARTFSANEAACVTGVPLRQVHRIIDAGLVGSSAQGDKHARAVHDEELVGLKLAHETTDVLTLEGRRRLVRYLSDHPDANTVHERCVSVDIGSMKEEVSEGCFRLKIACENVSRDDAVLGGIPCIKGTRIPAHDIADMLANGDSASSIQEAFPQLSEARIELAAFYARAYPRRGRPRRAPYWRGREAVASSEVALNELSAAR